jgi:hypothetical protein
VLCRFTGVALSLQLTISKLALTITLFKIAIVEDIEFALHVQWRAFNPSFPVKRLQNERFLSNPNGKTRPHNVPRYCTFNETTSSATARKMSLPSQRKRTNCGPKSSPSAIRKPGKEQ